MNDDPAMLELVYPRVSSIVMERFSAGNMTAEGLIPGDGRPGQGEVHVSPAINTLGCLELHSLALIASSVGKLEDAVEYMDWSRQYSSIVVRTFYDNSHDCFYARSQEGHFIAGRSPSLLLPLVVDRTISPAVRKRMGDRLLYNIETWRGSLDDDPLWAEPALRNVMLSLFAGLEGFPYMRLKALSESPDHRNLPATATGGRDPWTEMWKFMPARERLFTPENGMMSLLLFRKMARRESLLSERALPGFDDDIDALARALSAPPDGLGSHIDNIGLVNSLLLRMSGISDHLDKEERLWKILDVETWKRLSPRTRKMLSASAHFSIEELNRIKSVLTSSFLKSGGMGLKVSLPDMPVPTGSLIDLKVSVSSADSVIGLERVYLQSGGNRWSLSSPDEVFTTGPGSPPLEWTRALRLPAGTSPGIVPLPVFMDFMTGGKRVELHLDECVSVTTGYEVSLDMPSGAMLPEGGSLPLGISLRYLTETTVHGQVDGVFLDGLECSPSLPAKFAVRGGSEITELPLSISSGARPAPGR
ncbi:MAG TPA: hypothetical protein VLA34_08700, partial [Candidatus Krumholzibacterium sp.]|nr:hypothetical protein [Candidatus Krumholzibacterium sp.]